MLHKTLHIARRLQNAWATGPRGGGRLGAPCYKHLQSINISLQSRNKAETLHIYNVFNAKQKQKQKLKNHYNSIHL